MLNHISVQGRIVRDPEVTKTASGVSVLRFSVANDRDFKDADGNRGTDFLDCVAWRNTADFIGKYFHKGDMVALDGRLQINIWNDRDGNKRKTAEIQVNNAYFCGGGRSAAQDSAGAPIDVKFEEIDSPDGMPWEDEGDLPF